jgi:hypothetical protein
LLQDERERHRLARKSHAKVRRTRALPVVTAPLLEFYALEAGIKRQTSVRRVYKINCPKIFSFIEAPDEALEVLEQLIQASLTQKPRIEVCQDECELIDHEAEAAFSALAVEASKRLKIPFSGSFPKSDEQRNIVLAAGLPRSLGVDLPEPEAFHCFPLTRGRRAKENARKSSQREVLTTKLTEYVDECLLMYQYTLSDVAKADLSSLVGEVIGNAEDHSSRAEWWVAAYLRRHEKKIGDFHLTIFNFGKTLFESLQDLPAESRLRHDIDALVSAHSSRGFFRPNWTEENLWTLYALQEGVSRYNTGTSLGDRGQGTADMIEFFQNLGQTTDEGKEPKMCVVSGNTYILFDRRHQMRLEKTVNDEQRRIIAFNDENDLHLPPNKRNVKSLARKFPGTLMGLRLFLDQDYLTHIKEVKSGKAN